jgi:hypothetical protein
MARKEDLFVLKETLEQQMVNGLEMPVMTAKEAEDAGLMFFWTGKPCLRGHHSKRRVKGRTCMACGTIQSMSYKKDLSARSARIVAEVRAQKAVHTIGYNDQQKVLEVYSQSGSLEKAAKSVGKTVPELNVQMAKVEAFAVAVHNLEKRMKLSQDTDEYKPAKDLWDQEKRDLFVTAYIDTGDIQTARDAIKVSASVYHKELERNPAFLEAIKEAKPKADLALEEKAIQLALKGNDKLLTLVLKAKLPEYKDKIQIDQNTTIKLTDSQIEARILGLVDRYKDVLDGEVVEIGHIEDDSRGEEGTSFEPRRIGSETEVQQVSLHVPSKGSVEAITLSKAS